MLVVIKDARLYIENISNVYEIFLKINAINNFETKVLSLILYLLFAYN